MVALSSPTFDFSDHLRFKKILSNGGKQKGLTKQLDKTFILFYFCKGLGPEVDFITFFHIPLIENTVK